MTIQVGDKIPSVTLKVMGADGPQNVTTDGTYKKHKQLIAGSPT